MAEEETWYTIGQLLAGGYETSPQDMRATFPDIGDDDVVEDFNISDFPWLESIMLYTDGNVDSWLSLVGIPVEELGTDWDPGATATNLLAMAGSGVRDAVPTRHPVAIASCVGQAYMFAHTFANIPAVQGAATAPTVATSVIADLDRVAQLGFKT